MSPIQIHPTTVNYLVTGANRGIGLEIVQQLASKEDNVVIAGVRDPSTKAAKDLLRLSKNVIVVKIDSSSDTDAFQAAKSLQARGINHLDVVVANAGISTDWKSAKDVQPEDLRTVLNVNVVGPLTLFQAFVPLLEKSPITPKFLIVSSAIASMGFQRNLPYLATSYGASKAAVNFISLRIAIENPNIVSLALHPGLVVTEMAKSAQESLGQDIESSVSEGTAITPQQSAEGILKLAHESTLPSHSGKFFNATDGTELPW